MKCLQDASVGAKVDSFNGGGGWVGGWVGKFMIEGIVLLISHAVVNEGAESSVHFS